MKQLWISDALEFYLNLTLLHSPWYHSSSNSDLGFVQKSQTASRNVIQRRNQETNDVMEEDNSLTFRSFALNFVCICQSIKKIEIKPFIQFHEKLREIYTRVHLNWGFFLNIIWNYARFPKFFFSWNHLLFHPIGFMFRIFEKTKHTFLQFLIFLENIY